MSLPEASCDAVIFDLETSSLNTETGEIIAIEALRLSAEGKSRERFSVLIKPAKPISPQAEKLTGITNAMLDDQASFKDLAPAFLDFIGDAQLYTVHADFDQRFLNYQLSAVGQQPLGSHKFTDMLAYIPQQYRGRSIKGIVEASGVVGAEGLSVDVLEAIYRRYVCA